MKAARVLAASNHANAMIGQSRPKGLASDVPPQTRESHFEKLVAGQLKLLDAIADLQKRIDGLPERLNTSSGRHSHQNCCHGTTILDLDDVASRPPERLNASPPRNEAPRSDQPEKTSLKRPVSISPLSDLGTVEEDLTESRPRLTPHSPSKTGSRLYLNNRSRTSIELHPQFEEHARMDPEEVEEIAHEWAISGGLSRKKKSGALMSSHSIAGDTGHMLPFHPLALLPTIIDCLSVVVLLVDAIMVPVIVAWEVPAHGWLLIISAITLAFWTCDMILKFCTGFIKEACVIVSWRAIIKRYVSQGFVFDVTLILLDGVDLVRSLTSKVSSSSSSRQSRTLNLFRLIRLTKMIRMVRLSSRMGNRRAALRVWMVRWYGALSQAARYISFAGILVRLTFAIFALSHFLACTWYFMLQNATPEHSKDKSWVSMLPEMEDSRMYLYAVYWSLTTMFSGSSFLHPTLTWEIIYTTLLVLVGALFVTSITSTLAAVLIEVQLAWVEMKKKLSSMTEFLEQKHMPALVIVTTLEELAQHMSQKRSSVSEADVQVQLSLLSPNVRALLRYEQYHSSIMKLRIIQLVHILQPGIIQELCGTATFHFVKVGEEIFDVDKSMYEALFISVGQAQYVHWRLRTGGAHSFSSVGSGDAVPEETWLCEAALLVTWRTLGSLEAESRCEMLSISVDTFAKAVNRVPAMLAVVSSYSVEVARCLTSGEGEQARNDMNIGIDTDIIITSMPTVVRYRLVSAPRLGRLRHLQGSFAGHSRRQALFHLEYDMSMGKCHITTTEEGYDLRVVSLALLWLEDEEGHVCVQLGHRKKGAIMEIEPGFGLPGHTVESDESPVTAIERMLEDRFPDLAHEISISHPHEDPVIEVASSHTYGIPTKYIKYHVRASLPGSVSVAPELSSMVSLQEVSGKSQNVIASSFGLGSMATKGSRLSYGAFAIKAKDGGSTICEFVNKYTYEHRLKNREAETAALKPVFTRLAPEAIDSLSRCWRVIRTDEPQDTGHGEAALPDAESSGSSDDHQVTLDI